MHHRNRVAHGASYALAGIHARYGRVNTAQRETGKNSKVRPRYSEGVEMEMHGAMYNNHYRAAVCSIMRAWCIDLNSTRNTRKNQFSTDRKIDDSSQI